MDLNDMINPSRKPTWLRDDFVFWFDAIKNIMSHGMQKLKKVVAEGQYFKKDGIFYGGNDIAIEHDLLIKCLKEQSTNIFGVDLCKMAEKLTIVDVHTGLGRYGEDTLLTDQTSHGEKLRKLIPSYAQQNRILDFDTEGYWKEMYKDAVGNVTSSHGYSSLFGNSKDSLCVVEEFGTVDPVLVFKALRAENMAYHYSQGESLKDEEVFYKRGLDVKRAFYSESDPFWKNQIINSGVHVFRKALWR